MVRRGRGGFSVRTCFGTSMFSLHVMRRVMFVPACVRAMLASATCRQAPPGSYVRNQGGAMCGKQ